MSSVSGFSSFQTKYFFMCLRGLYLYFCLYSYYVPHFIFYFWWAWVNSTVELFWNHASMNKGLLIFFFFFRFYFQDNICIFPSGFNAFHFYPILGIGAGPHLAVLSWLLGWNLVLQFCCLIGRYLCALSQGSYFCSYLVALATTSSSL